MRAVLFLFSLGRCCSAKHSSKLRAKVQSNGANEKSKSEQGGVLLFFVFRGRPLEEEEEGGAKEQIETRMRSERNKNDISTLARNTAQSISNTTELWRACMDGTKTPKHVASHLSQLASEPHRSKGRKDGSKRGNEGEKSCLTFHRRRTKRERTRLSRWTGPSCY